MSDRLLSHEDAAWRALLESAPHDVYQRPEYVELEAEWIGGRSSAVLVDDDDRWLFIPLVIRHIADSAGLCDAISPYGYPGIIESAGLAPSDRSELFARAFDVLRSHGVISMFLRLNPSVPFALGSPVPEIVVAEHGETVVLDLSDDDDTYCGGLRSSTRYEIRRTYAAEVVVRQDKSEPAVRRFHELYSAAMDRVDATTSYHFTLEYAHRLIDLAGDRLQLFCAELDGEVVGAAMFFDSPLAVQYHLSAATRLPGPVSPTRVILDTARKHYKAMGRRYLQLGGGLGSAHDSLFRFKAGFTDQRAAFQSVRCVIDPGAYELLVSQWEATSGCEADRSHRSFFPAYRRPAPGPQPEVGQV